MSWEYDVRTKQFSLKGENRFSAMYAGADGYKDDPAFECVINSGPLPRGTYTIGEPENNKTTGYFSLRLTPDAGNSMCGRSRFLIHGDSASNPGKASQGCIVASIHVRKEISKSGVKKLVVK
ncbi:tlde1 domain-containing protein [Erwinia sorbitola]|uniref:DUF2778 domain-containing protein n=1 Tax=Erwinia sorbitola TaxID=2681984 RepID=A0A6I6EDE0_9GAMM|nr:tlde1 domain-containing protein [Erwinia sorbitola]QGU87827.1 DUF2778 domain-containing protein [Erwinia sorbitola]